MKSSKLHIPQKSLLPQQAFLSGKPQSVFNYICAQFPHIDASIWRARFESGKVHWQNGEALTLSTPIKPSSTVIYYREVEAEPVIPFDSPIVFENDYFLVVDKPHFLPVMPNGIFVDECLTARLCKSTGNNNLQAMHRLDNDTAGLVLFCKTETHRALYHDLFLQQRIEKIYLAQTDSNVNSALLNQQWHIQNCIERSQKSRRFCINPSNSPNTETLARCINIKNGLASFELQPKTGKTHQLRLHMQSLGHPILHDRLYHPSGSTIAKDDYAKPMQLVAKRLRFDCPMTNERFAFESRFDLND